MNKCKRLSDLIASFTDLNQHLIKKYLKNEMNDLSFTLANEPSAFFFSSLMIGPEMFK